MELRRADQVSLLPVLFIWIVGAFSVMAWLRLDAPAHGIVATVAAVAPAPPGGTTGSTSGSGALTASKMTSGSSVAIAATSRETARHAAAPRMGPPACRIADEATEPGAGGDWTLAVLDTALRLPSRYAPADLVPVARAGIPGGGSVRRILLPDLRALTTAARAAGIPLRAHSAYRSDTRQALVFAGWVRASGVAAARRASARPGHSEHQLGTALDLGADAAPWTVDFAASTAGRWLAAHVVDFGFVLSYPDGASDATCYDAEAWHVRWVGRDRAAAVQASGLTLREWLWRHPGG